MAVLVLFELPLWHVPQKQHWYVGLCIFSCVTLPQLSRKLDARVTVPQPSDERPPFHKKNKPMMPSCDKYLLMAFQKLLFNLSQDPSIFFHCLAVRLIPDQYWLVTRFKVIQLHVKNIYVFILWMHITGKNAVNIPRRLQPVSNNGLTVSFRRPARNKLHDSSPCRAPLWWHDRIFCEVRFMKLRNLQTSCN